MLRNLFVIIGLLLLALLSSACDEQDGLPAQPTQSSTTPIIFEEVYTVDPTFREFYEEHGGADRFGPAISPATDDGTRKTQYVVAGLVVYDPTISGALHYHFAPIGRELGFIEPPEPAPNDPSIVYIEGHIVDPSFLAIFEDLGGVSVVGPPLTSLRYNPELKRYEQFFERLGFYRNQDDESGSVHLLAYGPKHCRTACDTPALKGSQVVFVPRVQPPFLQAVERLGTDFSGFALTPTYIAGDGMVEQVFENVVLIVDPADPQQAVLRPIHQTLGILPETPVPPRNSSDSFFYQSRGEMGYNILSAFLDYLTEHGGLEISGPPISEPFVMKNQVTRQCFTNLCLEQSGDGNVRPAPLGYTYKQMSYTASSDILPSSDSTRRLTVQVWVKSLTISSSQEQEIAAFVQENDSPVVNTQPVLIVTLPDGSKQPYVMSPTNESGHSSIRIPPIDAPNSTLIPYEVCIDTGNGAHFCDMNTFLIWEEQ
jgi:hypothetical protein